MNLVFLMITDGPMQGHRFAIKSSDAIVIGRGADASVHIPYDPFCSRTHARIFCKDQEFYLEDLKSTNGTFLNGEKIEAPASLKNNDKLKLGNTEAVFIIKAEERETPPDDDVFFGD